jgi:hypothetical protein
MERGADFSVINLSVISCDPATSGRIESSESSRTMRIILPQNDSASSLSDPRESA